MTMAPNESRNPDRSLAPRLVPWALAAAGTAMLALATVGLRMLFTVLGWIGVSDDAVIGGIIIQLIGGGVVLFLVGLILALVRSGAGKAGWLIGSGLVLLVGGTGPLACAILTAADQNPNPIFAGMLAAVTILPVVILLICGFVALANRRGHAAG